MAPKSEVSSTRKEVVNKGAWSAEEDRKLAQYVQLHGPRRWQTLALKAGLNRCGKSCRLRWLNYLRPNIKRGNISDDEEDMILRLHRLLGNRWALIAGRLPGRTDNEIKNYWNSYLSKKITNQSSTSTVTETDRRALPLAVQGKRKLGIEALGNSGEEVDQINFGMQVDELFDFSTEGTDRLDWVSIFLASDEDPNWADVERRLSNDGSC